jgi:hypothetical protein
LTTDRCRDGVGKALALASFGSDYVNPIHRLVKPYAATYVVSGSPTPYSVCHRRKPIVETPLFALHYKSEVALPFVTVEAQTELAKLFVVDIADVRIQAGVLDDGFSHAEAIDNNPLFLPGKRKRDEPCLQPRRLQSKIGWDTDLQIKYRPRDNRPLVVAPYRCQHAAHVPLADAILPRSAFGDDDAVACTTVPDETPHDRVCFPPVRSDIVFGGHRLNPGYARIRVDRDVPLRLAFLPQCVEVPRQGSAHVGFAPAFCAFVLDFETTILFVVKGKISVRL